MRLQALPGMEDALPAFSHAWQHAEAAFRRVCALYDYREIRTPTLEDIRLFTRSAGETSDIVTKQMFDFVDKGDRHVVLKPESTAGVVRALVEHSLCPPGNSLRVCYVSSPHFRYERAQKGRLREHHQFGVELFGVSAVEADAEVIELVVRFLRTVGLTDLTVQLNSIGRAECRSRYAAKVLEHFAAYLADLGEEPAERARKNPLRLLDSKDPKAQEAVQSAPSILDDLEPECTERFERLQHLLAEAGVPFVVNPRIVRGLDYYTETVFEVESSALGAQSAVCGGGRYDNLVSDMGGAALPAVGFGMGVERLLMVMQAQGVIPEPDAPRVFVVMLGEAAREAGLCLARNWREAGCAVALDLEPGSMKSQMRQADASGARFAAILGDDEVAQGVVSLRDMQTKEQVSLPAAEAIAKVMSQ